MHRYLSDFILRELHNKNNHNILKYVVGNYHQPFALSQLVAATKEIKGVTSRNLLKLLLDEDVFKRLCSTNLPVCNPEDIVALVTELQEAVQFSKAIQTGFLYENEKKAPTFNANVFAQYFLSRVRTVVDVHGLIFIYSSEGVYRLLSDVELGQLIRILMNEGIPNSWKKRIEEEAIEAIKRECSSGIVMNTATNYINLKNGVYDLNKGLIEQHYPDLLSTVQIPIAFDSNATCPKFIQFMNEITCGDEQLIRVHQEILGYFLNSEIQSQKAFLYSGWGANGKSVLAKVIAVLVGEENVSSISLSQFSSDFGLQAILGKTVNIASENETKGAPLNTEIFKAMVSGDSLTINRKHRAPLTNYRMKCKFLFLTNHLPNTNDYSNGYFRRIMILPFKRTFKESKQNPYLFES